MCYFFFSGKISLFLFFFFNAFFFFLRFVLNFFYFRFAVTCFFIYDLLISFWLFLPRVFSFPIEIFLLLLFLILLVPLLNIFNVFLIFYYLLQQNRNFFWCPKVFFFISGNCLSFISIAFLYFSKFFSASSRRKLICSSLICWVDMVGLNFYPS